MTSTPTAPTPSSVRLNATVHAVIDSDSSVWSAGNAFLVEPFLDGSMPVHTSTRAERIPSGIVPVAPGGEVIRTRFYDHGRQLLADGDGWRAMYRLQDDRSASLEVVAVDEATARSVVDDLHRRSEPMESDPHRLVVQFVRLTNCGPESTGRRIQVPMWPEVAHNYPSAARHRLASLIDTDAQHRPEGRLLLLHGPAGTGKTTFIRALSSAWRPWCGTTVVVDPDQLFDKSAYLFDAIMAGTVDEDDEDDDDRWTMFVIEDCDELLRSDAKREAGQALSRLLNLADGILGQGLRVLFCLTTNEPLERIHPALTRPGRCLANIEIGRFEPDEARDWLRASGVGRPERAMAIDRAVTLAEMYALAADISG